MPGTNDQDRPSWQLVEDAGTVMLDWQGSPGENIHRVPLGPPDEVAARMADWLAQRDFGE